MQKAGAKINYQVEEKTKNEWKRPFRSWLSKMWEPFILARQKRICWKFSKRTLLSNSFFSENMVCLSSVPGLNNWIGEVQNWTTNLLLQSACCAAFETDWDIQIYRKTAILWLWNQPFASLKCCAVFSHSQDN